MGEHIRLPPFQLPNTLNRVSGRYRQETLSRGGRKGIICSQQPSSGVLTHPIVRDTIYISPNTQILTAPNLNPNPKLKLNIILAP